MQQMGFYDRGLHFLCNKWFSMIEDLSLSLSLQQMVFMREDFIDATNEDFFAFL